MSSAAKKSPGKARHYVRGSVLAFGEDRGHEFKGHRNLSVEEIPRWAVIPGTRRGSRKAASRSLNGFLNTGEGGTVYLGVLDDGTVRGLHMSSFQRDHVKVALNDLMDRYTPRVPKSRYKVEFVPVFSSESALITGGENTDSVDVKGNHLNTQAHLLRTAHYCWCDKHAISLYNKGIKLPVYVVEIKVSPFTPNPTVHWTTLQLHPVYENEEGKCFFRQSASNHMYSYQEIVELTVRQAKTHFELTLKRLREEKCSLERKL